MVEQRVVDYFWLLSSKVPPLTYIATAIFQNIFGTGLDQATLVNLFFSAILLSSVYGLGVQLFSVEVGLWASCIMPDITWSLSIPPRFLLDYPLTACCDIELLVSYGLDKRQEESKYCSL